MPQEFPILFRDPEEEAPLGRCAQCTHEVYPGEDYFTDGAQYVHAECMEEYMCRFIPAHGFRQNMP
jgi:hypothetical protein